MSIKKTAIALAISAIIAPAAFADNGWTWIGGEAVWQAHAMSGTRSRAEVLRELEAFRKDPVATDGWRHVGGEIGDLPPQHAIKLENGRWVHADKFDHDTPKPGLSMSPAERQRHQQLYSGA